MNELWKTQIEINNNVQAEVDALTSMIEILTRKYNLLENEIQSLKEKFSENEES